MCWDEPSKTWTYQLASVHHGGIMSEKTVIAYAD